MYVGRMGLWRKPMCNVICKVVYQVFDEMSLWKQIPNGEEFGHGPFIRKMFILPFIMSLKQF